MLRNQVNLPLQQANLWVRDSPERQGVRLESSVNTMQILANTNVPEKYVSALCGDAHEVVYR